MIRCDWLSEHLNSGGFIGSRENIVSCPFSSPLLSVLLIILGFCATVTLTHESLFFLLSLSCLSHPPAPVPGRVHRNLHHALRREERMGAKHLEERQAREGAQPRGLWE